MELRVNDYVRTLDGIMKVIECRDNRFVNEDGNVYFYSDMMCNPSSDIIDLIGENDLVKIEFYSPRYRERITRLFEVEIVLKKENYISFQNAHINLLIISGKWSRNDKLLKPIIKSIVTCEQFLSMEYKVEE